MEGTDNVLVGIMYFLLSLFCAVVSFKLKKRYSGENFKKRYFYMVLTFNIFVCSFHFGVWYVGYNPFIPETEPWLKGNGLVALTALLFAIPQAYFMPYEY